MIARQILYEGRVQGIGFRYAVKQIAKGFSVTGFVRNLPDGRVELQVQGDDEELREFFEAIRESELRAHIKKEDEHPLVSTPGTRGFEIRHD